MGIMRTLTINGEKYNIAPVVPATSVTLLANAWRNDGDTYSQVVELPGVTVHTKVDLQPTAEQLVEFHDKILAFVAENDGGVITVYSIGDIPTGDHTIQTTLTEVEGTGKIRGNTVGTTMPQSDWNQTDATKADYIKNKPTYAELGAAPAGYGLGGAATLITDANTATKSGFYAMSGASAVNCATEIWDFFRYGTLLVEVRSYTGIQQTISFRDRCAKRSSEDYGATWSSWVDCSPSAFAPAGYGLGTDAPRVADCNLAIKNGWYTTGGATNAPPSGSYGWMFVATRSDTNVAQEYYTATTPVTHWTRYRIDGNWGEWTCVNPPLVTNTEYRTSERWNGKAVYAKLLDIGTLPANGTKSYTGLFTTGTRLVDVELIAYGSEPNSYQQIPLAYNSGITSFVFHRDSGNVAITTNTTFANIGNVYLKAKYWLG